MSAAFKSYEAAFNHAVREAREGVEAGRSPESCEMGLEHNALYREYVVRMLPLPQNRYGSELRCQVVRASDPLMEES